MKWFEWLARHDFSGPIPFGTHTTDIIEGPPDQVTVTVYRRLITETLWVDENPVTVAWSSVDVSTHFLNDFSINNQQFRVWFDSEKDVIFISQCSWTHMVKAIADGPELAEE